MKNILLSFLFFTLVHSITVGQSNSGPYSIHDLEKIYILNSNEYVVYLNNNGFVDTKGKSAGLVFYRETSNEDMYLSRSQKIRESALGGNVILNTNYKERVDKIRNSLSLNGYISERTVSGTDIYIKRGNNVRIEYKSDTKSYTIILITFLSIESSNNTVNEDKPSNGISSSIFNSLPQSLSDLEKIAKFNREELDTYLANNSLTNAKEKSGFKFFIREGDDVKLAIGYKMNYSTREFTLILATDSEEMYLKIKNSLSKEGYVYIKNENQMDIYRKPTGTYPEVGFGIIDNTNTIAIQIQK